nr:hypothetical protein [uncultured Flavobacterium sp.]
MAQPWIHKAKTDSLFILSPPFVILAVVLLCQPLLIQLENHYSFYTWLFFVVFIDVAHVYATLFKTYFVPTAFRERKRLLLALPVICFTIGLVLFSLGSKVFWVTMAYVAVFHFIRQQYGFMRLYARKEPKTKLNRYTDSLIIYAATGYPMLYWFMSPPRQYTWFMPNEFFSWQNPQVLQGLTLVYYGILAFYVLRTAYIGFSQKYFNIPKNAIIIGTALSWYFGIVYYNNDLVFTLLNVISHGIPYMGLIYLKEIQQPSQPVPTVYGYLKRYWGVIPYVAVLVFFAFSEEYLWEIFVWNGHFNVGLGNAMQSWQFLLVPLLTVPQFTHYILDGFIWKSKKT